MLDALSSGQFFVTTGEVLISGFDVNGTETGATLPSTTDRSSVTLNTTLEWTYPLAYMEVVSGDGTEVYRQRIELSDTREFGERNITLPLDLSERKWVRVEVWDVARNGAFTQSVWLE